MSKKHRLDTKLIILLEGYNTLPGTFSSWDDDTPASFTGFDVDDGLQIPKDVRTRTPRALYSVRNYRS